MANIYDRIRSNIREILLNDAMAIPLEEKGGLPVSKWGVAPDDVTISNMEDLGPLFGYFNSLEEAKDPITRALLGIRGLMGYLKGATFVNRDTLKPDAKFRIATCENDFHTPKLDSFYYDNRIFIRVLRRLDSRYRIRGAADYGEDGIDFNCQISFPESTRIRRDFYIDFDAIEDEVSGEDYDEDNTESFLRDVTLKELLQNSPVNVHRYPILFNASMASLDRYACLACDVLSNLLEPYTTANTLADVVRSEELDEDVVYSLKEKHLAEEDIIANSITRSWLASAGVNMGRALNYFDRVIDDSTAYRALMQVQTTGPRAVVRYYSDFRTWNLDDFLEGRWIESL